MKKMYSIEFLRVYLLFLIILGHTKMAEYYNSLSDFFHKILYTMGTHVDIFLLICGFFLFKSISKNNTNFWDVLKHRAKRLLPAVVFYKICMMIFFNDGSDYALTNLMMLNSNIGIYVPTISHIVWYVDAMFICWVFYAALFASFDKKKSLFAVGVITLISLMLLFTSSNVNLHFQMLKGTLIDGGVLRCLSFMGMGILLSAMPVKQSGSKSYLCSIFELLVLIMAFLYPGFVKHDSGMVLNHVLWCVLFIYLAVKECGFVFSFLNKQKWLFGISKYCYEAYVFQLFAITLGYKWFSPNSAPVLTGLGIIILSFVFGKIFKDYIEVLLFKLMKKEYKLT